MERKVPLEPGEASVRAWAAGVSLCCRPRPCCRVQAGVWGGRWHAAPGEAEEGRRSCASSPYCWWDWAERGPVTRVSASGAAPGVRPGCCLCHLEDARWLWSLEASGQQLGNWGLGGPVYQPGSLNCPWLPQGAALALLLGRDLPWPGGQLLQNRNHHCLLWVSQGWERSDH